MTESRPTSINEQFITESAPVGLPWRLLVFGVVIFGLSIAIYLGLRFGYSAYLDSRSKDIEQKLSALGAQVKAEDQKNFINFYSQLLNLKTILDNHEFSANIFSFLEKNTLAAVYYTEASLSSSNETLTLKGETDSSETLVGQMNVFDRAPELLSVALDQMNFDPRGGRVSFSATIIFNKDYFLRQAR